MYLSFFKFCSLTWHNFIYIFLLQTCEELMDKSILKESLRMYSNTHDPMLQKVVTKVIFCMMETKERK